MITKKHTADRAAAFLLIAIAFISTLTGCSTQETDVRRNIRETITNINTNSNTETSSREVAKKSEIEQKVEDTARRSAEADPVIEDLGQIVRFTKADSQAVRSVVSGTNVIYPFVELYQLEKAINVYNSFPEYDNSRVLVTLSQTPITAARLHEIVKRNNIAYLDGTAIHLYTELNDEYVEWICGIIADTLNSELR